jgi:hypothetical protein
LPSDSLESVYNPHTSSHGLAGVELTKLPLNALTSNQSNCNASISLAYTPDSARFLSAWSKWLFVFNSNFVRLKQTHRSASSSRQRFDHPTPIDYWSAAISRAS